MRYAALCLVALSLPACGRPFDHNVYTLYRSAIIGGEAIHVATFDAKEGRDYNETNCLLVRDLIQSQPGVTVSYWCTQGRP